MGHARWGRAALLGAALASAAMPGACGEDPVGPGDRLAEARLRWHARGPTDYEYVFQASCFCGPEAQAPVRVAVEDGEVVSVTSVETGEPARPAFPGETLSVEGLFSFLAGALAGEPASFEATYHPELGHPTSASIDFEEQVVDEEFAFEVRELGGPVPLASAAP